MNLRRRMEMTSVAVVVLVRKRPLETSCGRKKDVSLSPSLAAWALAMPMAELELDMRRMRRVASSTSSICGSGLTPGSFRFCCRLQYTSSLATRIGRVRFMATRM